MDEKLAGAIRHVLTLIGGWFVAKGKLDPASVDTLVGIATAIIGFAWSYLAKKA